MGIPRAAIGGPTPEGKSDAADASLHQTTGCQKLLDAAIAVTHARVFTRKIESPANCAGRDQIESAGREGMQAGHGPRTVEVAPDVLERFQQIAAFQETF